MLKHRLQAMMDQEGYTQNSLAVAIGKTQGTIQQLLSGKTQRSRYLPEIARVLGTSVDFLLGTTDDPSAPNDAESWLGKPKPIARTIPRIGTSGDYLNEDSTLYLAAPAGLAGRKLAAAEVVGDAMQPELAAGDEVIMDTEQTSVDAPGLYVFQIGNRLEVRRARLTNRGDRVQLLASNPLYPAEELDPDQAIVKGRVVGTFRKT